MKKHAPQIEIYPGDRFMPPGLIPQARARSHRLIIFITVFVLCAAAGLAYTYSRPAVYRSSASLLTSAMTAIDQGSVAADVQYVAIQKQLLLGRELLAETGSRLQSSAATPKLTADAIQQLLTVVPVPETNLVEIRAEGADPELLARLVNTWTDVYRDARAKDIKKSTDNTTQMIDDELQAWAEKVNAKRAELENFRHSNDISSEGSGENEPLARLNGLTSSLNKAEEDEVKAKAALDAVKSAIALGQAVVPDREQGTLQNLETRLQELQEKLADFDKKFTRDYMVKKYPYNPIPEQIKKLEAEIKKQRDYGKRIVLTEASGNYTATQQTVADIRAQLVEQKKQAAVFTTKFAEYQALKADLENLERLYRETQERLVKIETSQKEKYPQLTVIDRAYASSLPIRPDYRRDALIALAGSLFAGLFAVWLVDYLSPKQEPPAPINLSGIHLYNPAAADRLAYRQTAARPLEQQAAYALAGPMHRELSSHQLRLLLKAANLKAKQLIGLLLTGLTPAEAAGLTASQIDLETANLTIAGASPRILIIGSALKTWLAQSDWDAGASTDELDAALLCAAVDSGLPNPAEITAAAIRHSYIAYLVRQGLRLSELAYITGRLEPAVISSYSSYSPPQPGRGLDEIERLHPALADSV